MPAVYLRGGIPKVIASGSGNVPTSLQKWEFPMVSNQIVLAAGSNDIRVYFSQADADADANYYTVSSGASIDWPAELGAIWTKAQSGAADMTLVIFQAR